jgi:hypothetical protein
MQSLIQHTGHSKTHGPEAKAMTMTKIAVMTGMTLP